MQQNKRPRQEEHLPMAMGPPIDPAAMSSLLEQLDPQAIKQLLFHASMAFWPVAQSVSDAVEAKRRAEAVRTINFDHYSKQAWYSLFKEHSRKSGSKQHDAGYEVAREIEEMFQDMSKRSGQNASFNTRQNAVETMRKIMKSILLAGDEGEVGDVVLNNVEGLDDTLVEVLGRIDRVGLQLIHDSELRAKLVEIQSLASPYCVFKRIQEAIDLLDNATHEDQEEDEDDD